VSVNPKGVEEVVCDVESRIQVSRGKSKFSFREGAAGIRPWMIEVKVAQNKLRVGKSRKKAFGGNGGVLRTVDMEKI